MRVKTQVDARKEARDRAGAIAVVGPASRVIAIRGKKVMEFDRKETEPDDEVLLGAILGPTGNLRAPTIVRGKTVLVGFHPDPYGEVLG